MPALGTTNETQVETTVCFRENSINNHDSSGYPPELSQASKKQIERNPLDQRRSPEAQRRVRSPFSVITCSVAGRGLTVFCIGTDNKTMVLLYLTSVNPK